MNTDFICTWIYLDSAEESSEYPQVGTQSHLIEFQKVYWKCVAVFFAASLQTNPNRQHILFSNRKWEEIPTIEGFGLRDFLHSNGVEVVTLPLTFQTPPGYFGRFRNQFYIFDITQYLENNFTAPAAFVVLDSDCIIQKSLDALFDHLHRCHLMVLPMGFDENYEIHGITRRQMQQIFDELDGRTSPRLPLPEYFGGEILAATLPAIQQINAQVPGLWQEMLRRHAEGKPKLNEEAHFLSYLYQKMGEHPVLTPYIKRIWTSARYTNVQQQDVGLPIWHLPAEKKGGIALLFEHLKSGNLPDVSEWGEYLGIPRRRHYRNFRHFLKCSWLYRRWVQIGSRFSTTVIITSAQISFL